MNEESWDQISGGKGPFPYLGYTHLSVTVKLTENQPEISPFFFCRSELSDLISSSLSCNNDAVLTKSNERQKPRLQVKGNKCRTCVCVCVAHLFCCSWRASWFFFRVSVCLVRETWAACTSFSSRSVSLNLQSRTVTHLHVPINQPKVSFPQPEIKSCYTRVIRSFLSGGNKAGQYWLNLQQWSQIRTVDFKSENKKWNRKKRLWWLRSQNTFDPSVCNFIKAQKSVFPLLTGVKRK